MLTLQEIELLAGLLQRAGVNVYEMVWANSILDKLRTDALSADNLPDGSREQGQALEQKEKEEQR